MKRRASKVHTVSGRHPSLKGGFIGMNAKAARAHKLPWKYPKGDIVVKKGLSKGVRRRTIKHERAELSLMNQGVPYSKAHPRALKAEKE